MNKRIQELKEQATRTAMWPGDPDAGDIDAEKFAELIVRECAKNAVLFAESTKIQGLPSKYIENYMLKHFGVEE